MLKYHHVQSNSFREKINSKLIEWRKKEMQFCDIYRSIEVQHNINEPVIITE